MTTYVVAFLCAVGLAIGQILFKVSVAALSASESLFTAKATVPLFAAMWHHYPRIRRGIFFERISHGK
jgi:hypothetical protein